MEQAIRDLQTMLTAISHVQREIPRLRADGQFGEAPLEAVMIFQRQADIPGTGEVDQHTWDAIVQTHKDVQRQLAPPARFPFCPTMAQISCPGSSPPSSTPSRECSWPWHRFSIRCGAHLSPDIWTRTPPTISAGSRARAHGRRPGSWTKRPGRTSLVCTRPSSPATRIISHKKSPGQFVRAIACG